MSTFKTWSNIRTTLTQAQINSHSIPRLDPIDSKSSFELKCQATLNRHFMRGGSHYPVGGASEIAYNIIPLIEAGGGRVLVRANVTDILERQGRVCGVRVSKGTENHEIYAPLVISSAG